MLFRSEDEHHGGTLRKVRDIVEIVAIIAAGIWAFYIFIYENRIVPAQAQPAATFTATLEKVSEHNGLIGVRLVAKVHNISTVTDHFIGLAVAVVGQRVIPTRSANPIRVVGSTIRLNADFDLSPNELVFAQGKIFKLGDAKSKSELPLEPGAETSEEYVFYVHAGRYDRLQSIVLARFKRDQNPEPTTFALGAHGLPDFNPPARDDNRYEQFANYTASLDLNGH